MDNGGWRLPTQKELHSLVADERSNPAINTDVFHNTVAYGYWTSEINGDNTDAVKIVCFFVGGVGYQDKRGKDHIRCVRNME